MVSIEELRSAVIEKQSMILEKLPSLAYDETLRLAASISAIISNLESLQGFEELKYHTLISEQLSNDPKASFAKVEAIMKSSNSYVSYRNVVNLKQCALRMQNLAKIHLEYILKNDNGDAIGRSG
ncbi:MAG: hypothetical protein AB8G05_28520 [Oligoflexales bacterium]